MSERDYVISKALRGVDDVEKALNTMAPFTSSYAGGADRFKNQYFQSRRGEATRRADNAGVKDGTVRMGAGGRTMRRYNSRAARWERVMNYKPSSKPASKPGGEPPNRSQKAALNSAESKNMRMGYQYNTKYGKPANPYSNRGASMKNVKAGQPKAIRPSGGPTRFSRSSKKK